MYARVVKGQLQPGKLEEFLGLFNEEFLPALRSSPGFEQAFVVPDPGNNTILALVLFASRADADADEAGFRERAVKAAPLLAAPPEAAVLEVAVHA
jgi:hypothetical protein